MYIIPNQYDFMVTNTSWFFLTSIIWPKKKNTSKHLVKTQRIIKVRHCYLSFYLYFKFISHLKRINVSFLMHRMQVLKAVYYAKIMFFNCHIEIYHRSLCKSHSLTVVGLLVRSQYKTLLLIMAVWFPKLIIHFKICRKKV